MKAIISYNDPKSVISEQYRAIRTNIEYSNVDQNTKTILVTSSDKNEGKTTTVSNLAVSFANLNKKVLLIDCDLRNASIHKMFRLNNIYGLTDILAKDRAVDKCIQETELKNLYVLTAGAIPPNPAEILSSDKMKNLIENLKNVYDYIFIDTPPIGLVTDAGALSSFIDGVVLVVKSESIEKKYLEETKKKLDAVDARILGAILNSYKSEQKDYNYYSYYGK